MYINAKIAPIVFIMLKILFFKKKLFVIFMVNIRSKTEITKVNKKQIGKIK